MTEREAPRPERITFDEWFMRSAPTPLPEKQPLLIETTVSFSAQQAVTFGGLAESYMLSLNEATRSAIQLLDHIYNHMHPGDTLYANTNNGYEKYDFFAPLANIKERQPARALFAEQEARALVQHADRYSTSITDAFSHAVDVFNTLHTTKGLLLEKTDGTLMPLPNNPRR